MFATYQQLPPQRFTEGDEWDQEQTEEIEGFAALEQLLLIQDDLEQEQQIENIIQIFEEHEVDLYNHVQSQLQQYETTLEDNHEQLQQIDHIEQLRQEEQQERNEHDLNQLE